MSRYIFINGNNLHLSVAELYSLYPSINFIEINKDFLLFDVDTDIEKRDFDRLGAFIKSSKIVKVSNKKSLIKDLSELLSSFYTGSKLNYALSFYGFNTDNSRLFLDLKKSLKKSNIKSRFINNNFQNLTPAQYKAFGANGLEIIISKVGDLYYIAVVIAVQDIDSYTKRDIDKPFRSMKMGMLPPKLAQILLNLSNSDTVFDPFCGSGTILMEAVLMGKKAVGSDIEKKHVDGADENLEWLGDVFGVDVDCKLFVHDARDAFGFNFSNIVFEGNLGDPHNRSIKTDDLMDIIDDLSDLYMDFFENLKSLNKKLSIVAALPFFQLNGNKTLHLNKVLDFIEKLGFKKVALLPKEFSENQFQLLYIRSNQAVGREIYKFEI